MKLKITKKEKDIIGRLFGAYINLHIDYNDTIDQKFRHPQFSDFTERVTKIKSHIKNLEELADELGYNLYVEKEPKNIPKVVTAFFGLNDNVLMVFDFPNHELYVDRSLL